MISGAMKMDAKALTELKATEVVESLIEWHFEIEPDLQQVLWIGSTGDSIDDGIKLLEVNAATVPSERVEAFAFSPAGDIPFRVVVAEITPEELEQLHREPERLPTGWDLDSAVRYQRPKVAA